MKCKQSKIYFRFFFFALAALHTFLSISLIRKLLDKLLVYPLAFLMYLRPLVVLEVHIMAQLSKEKHPSIITLRHKGQSIQNNAEKVWKYSSEGT